MQIVLGWDLTFSIVVSSLAVAAYVALGGLKSAIYNEILQFLLIWAGALLVPILGLIEVGGWTNLRQQIATNLGRSDYVHLWSTLGHFNTNPMGVNWFGIVFGLGFVVSFGYWTTDFLVVQRILSADSIRSARMAPVIGADNDDIASSISFTAVLGVVVVLTLPLLVPVLQLSLTQYGVLAGLTVYAVPQVLAATLPIGALSNQVGTVVKLVRVLMLGPVVLGLSVLARDLRTTGVRTSKNTPSWQELVPWFITGFIVVLIVRSLDLIPQVALPTITKIAATLTTIAMAALGLGVDIRVVAKSGVRVTLAVTASLIVLGSISYVLIRVAEIT